MTHAQQICQPKRQIHETVHTVRMRSCDIIGAAEFPIYVHYEVLKTCLIVREAFAVLAEHQWMNKKLNLSAIQNELNTKLQLNGAI